MDTSEVAQLIGTTPRLLRQFLRSPMSTYVAVGSGARYEFTERDVTTIAKRFLEWQGMGKPRPDTAKKIKAAKPSKAEKQTKDDSLAWEEEGPVVIPDIRDPRVRARVQANARDAENRLMMQLIAAGLHITQIGDRQAS